MSTGAVSAWQQAYGNVPQAVGGASYPSQAQASQQQNSSATPHRAWNGDSIHVSNESVSVPLLPNAAAELAKDEKQFDTHVPALGVVAFVATLIAFAAFIGIRVAMEIRGSVGKANSNVFAESLEHSLREAQRTAKEPAVDWVRAREKMFIDPKLIDDVTRDLHQTWDEFEAADKALLKAVKNSSENNESLGKKLVERSRKLEKVHKSHFPLRDNTQSISPEVKLNEKLNELKNSNDSEVEKAASKYYNVELKHDAIPSQVAIGNFAGSRILSLYHDTLNELSNTLAKDGDNWRLVQSQSQMFLEGAVGYPNVRRAALNDPTSRAAGRELEFRTKLAHVHQQAMGDFLRRVGR